MLELYIIADAVQAIFPPIACMSCTLSYRRVVELIMEMSTVRQLFMSRQVSNGIGYV